MAEWLTREGRACESLYNFDDSILGFLNEIDNPRLLLNTYYYILDI